MESQSYNGYSVWGQAILQQEDILQSERYAASRTITMGGKLIEASGVLGHFSSEEEAQLQGWTRPAPGSMHTGEITTSSATAMRTDFNPVIYFLLQIIRLRREASERFFASLKRVPSNYGFMSKGLFDGTNE
ncbi:hypothetical protein SAMN05446635_9969 [Burkholderia sp. OK233]|nr:hypothetical protein SAMN05446635_9969 [Burkholderia sp. OK233]